MHDHHAQLHTPLELEGLCGVVHADRPGDPAIAALARVQHGVVSHRQLAAAGLGRGAIAHRVAQGRLHRLHRGIYLVGHAAEPPLAREVAALLACGPGAVLSYRTAARLWGLLREPPTRGRRAGGTAGRGPGGASVAGRGSASGAGRGGHSGTSAGRSVAAEAVDVTVAGRDCGRRAGVRAHRALRLPPEEIARNHGLPLTAPARTLVDLGDDAEPGPFERAVEEALVQRLTTEEELRAAAAAAPNRPGAARLSRLLGRQASPALTRSEAERRLVELIDAAKLPRPRTNAVIGRHEVDAVWPAARLVVEVDGYAFHSSRAAFERDRSRDADLQALGYRVVRITWRQLTDSPEAVAVRLARLLLVPGR